MSGSTKIAKSKPATVSLPADLMGIIDEYVEKHKAEGVTRSSVVEEGMRLWLQTLRDQRDFEYFSKIAQALKTDNDSWSAIAAEADQKNIRLSNPIHIRYRWRIIRAVRRVLGDTTA